MNSSILIYSTHAYPMNSHLSVSTAQMPIQSNHSFFLDLRALFIYSSSYLFYTIISHLSYFKIRANSVFSRHPFYPFFNPFPSLQSFSTKRYGYFLPIFRSPSPPHPYLCSNIQFLSPKRRAPLLAPLLYIPILVLIFNFSLPNAGLLSLF